MDDSDDSGDDSDDDKKVPNEYVPKYTPAGVRRVPQIFEKPVFFDDGVASSDVMQGMFLFLPSAYIQFSDDHRVWPCRQNWRLLVPVRHRSGQHS